MQMLERKIWYIFVITVEFALMFMNMNKIQLLSMKTCLTPLTKGKKKCWI